MELINLDKNAAVVQRAVWSEDIRKAFPSCWVIFADKNKNVFDFSKITNTFTYKGMAWNAVSYRVINVSGARVYSCVGYPEGVCKPVTELSKQHFSALANSLNAKLSAGSLAAPAGFTPIKAKVLGQLLYQYRIDSFNKALEDKMTPKATTDMTLDDFKAIMEKTHYVGLLRPAPKATPARMSTELCVKDYKTLSKAAATTIFSKKDQIPSSAPSVSIITDELLHEYHGVYPPNKLTYKKFFETMFGKKIEITCDIMCDIGAMYTLSSDLGTDVAGIKGVMLIKQSIDSRNTPQRSQLTFAEVTFGEH